MGRAEISIVMEEMFSYATACAEEELSGTMFYFLMALDDDTDLYENGKYEGLFFSCILEGIVPFVFAIAYLHDMYDASSKQRYRILEETSPGMS